MMGLLVLAQACATSSTSPPPSVPAANAATPPPPPVCDRSFERRGTARPLADLPATLIEPRKLAPRADFAVFVPGTGQVAYVDRATNELRTISSEGGDPRTLFPRREGPQPREQVSRLAPGSQPGFVTFYLGVDRYRLHVSGDVPPERMDPEDPAAPWRSALMRRGLRGAEQVIPLTGQLAAVSVPAGRQFAAGLFALDLERDRFVRAVPEGLSVAWAPQKADGTRVLFGGSDGRYHLVDLSMLRHQCASAPMPEGHTPGPFTVSADGRKVIYSARRPGPGGFPSDSVGVLDLESGEDRLLFDAEGISAITATQVPGQQRFVVAVRWPSKAVLLLIDERGVVSRLSGEIPGLALVDVSTTAVVYTREKDVTELIPTPKPPEVQRDPRMGCDPVPPMGGGCGWVSNGCDWVFMGPCVRQVEPPDPADGVYLLPLP